MEEIAHRDAVARWMQEVRKYTQAQTAQLTMRHYAVEIGEFREMDQQLQAPDIEVEPPENPTLAPDPKHYMMPSTRGPTTECGKHQPILGHRHQCHWIVLFTIQPRRVSLSTWLARLEAT